MNNKIFKQHKEYQYKYYLNNNNNMYVNKMMNVFNKNINNK
jgi:hypothetical protein